MRRSAAVIAFAGAIAVPACSSSARQESVGGTPPVEEPARAETLADAPPRGSASPAAPEAPPHVEPASAPRSSALERTRIVAVHVQGAGAVVQVALGSDDGVTPAWTAAIVDASGAAIPGGEITLTRVDRRMATGSVRLAMPVILEHPFVQLAPPP